MSLNNPDYRNLLKASQQSQFATPAPIDSSYFQGLQNAYLPPEQIQAMYNAQVNAQTPLPSSQLPSEDMNALAAELLAQRDATLQSLTNQQAEAQRRSMEDFTPINIEGHPYVTNVLNFPFQVGHDIKEIGTGLGSMVQHPKKNIYDPYMNYITNTGVYNQDGTVKTAGQRFQDIYNAFMGGATGVPLEDTLKGWDYILKGKGFSPEAKAHAKKMRDNFLEEFRKNPFIVSSILAPQTTNALVGKGVRGIGQVAEKAGIPIGQVSRDVAAIKDATRVKYAAKQAGITEATKEVRKASLNDLAKVLRNTREGDARVPLNEKQIKLRDDVRKASIEYNKLIDDNALVSNREMSALQYVADTTGKTFQEVRRELTPQLELLQDGVTDQALRFENRLSNFEKDLNSFNKANKKNKITLKDDAKFTTLTGDAAKLFEKHLTEAELAGLIETEATVGEAIQFLRDTTRDAMTSSKVIDKVASNAKYQENLRKLGQLATESGDQTLQRFYEGIRLADKGEIFQTTFAGAEIPVGATVSEIGRRYQGKSSSREFGTATPEAQAKAWKENILTYVDDIVRNKVENEIADNILNGTIDGERPLIDASTKAADIRYINPQLVSEGSLLKAVENAVNTPTEGFIPIDKNYITALKGNLFYPETVFKGSWGDMFRASKSTMLASGNFLGGNVLSGLFGTLMNSDNLALTANDFVKSIASKGQLAKKLGVYRELGLDNRRFETLWGKVLNATNQLFGGRIIRAADALAQNTFAEMNAQRALRQRGINPDKLNQASKAKLGELINDIRLSSMMPSSFRIIPAKLQGALGPIQPFVNWTDTALQVTYDMYRRHPYLAGMAAADFFGNIGIDKELQNRLNLGVKSDKMFVSYKADRNGNIKETTIDFLPQMTAMKLLQHPKDIIRSGIPAVTPILNSLEGKNAFGNYMKRTHEFGQAPTTIYQGNRYRTNPETGMVEKIEGGMGDEILSTAIRQLWGVPALMNRTIGPTFASIASGISGKNIRYYQPYGQSVFGSFSTYQPDTIRAMFSSGNPANPRTLSDVLKGLGTYYESDYYPQEDSLSGRTIKALRRKGARASRREYQKYIQDLQGEDR